MKKKKETEKQIGLKLFLMSYMGGARCKSLLCFCGFYITIGLQSDSEPKDFYNHDGSHSLKKTDVFKILLSK